MAARIIVHTPHNAEGEGTVVMHVSMRLNHPIAKHLDGVCAGAAIDMNEPITSLSERRAIRDAMFRYPRGPDEDDADTRLYEQVVYLLASVCEDRDDWLEISL